MAQVTFSVRMDEELKTEFDALCKEFGMTASTAINVFARTVVRERRIPFEIHSFPKEPVARTDQPQITPESDMTLEVIRQESDLTRYSRKK